MADSRSAEQIIRLISPLLDVRPGQIKGYVILGVPADTEADAHEFYLATNAGNDSQVIYTLARAIVGINRDAFHDTGDT